MVEKPVIDKNSIPYAEWPDDAPLPAEGTIMSVACGNTHLHWAIHNGKQDKFAPVLFWRTPPLHNDERQDDPCVVLSRHLPKQAHALFFGDENAPPSKSVATQVSAKREIPAVSVFVISTNEEHESALKFIFQDVAVRMVKLRNTDFYTKEQGIYDTMGVDRAATLLAAEELYSAPVMVMDAGTAWTYTALDRNRHILGGGISPGLAARFRAMSDYCGDLPLIDFEKYERGMKAAMERNEPLPVFATDTETAMLSSVFTEICNQSRSLVKHFLERVKTTETSNGTAEPAEKSTAEDAADENTKKSSKPSIALTGGDANFLHKVLQKDCSRLVYPEPGAVLPAGDFNIYVMKHLCHYGIGHLLKRKSVKTSNNPDDELRDRLVGLRVAKYFGAPDDDGDHIYRGSILKISREDSLENDLAFVRYDDGDSEHVGFAELYRLLKLYNERGEKSEVDSGWVEDKKKTSNETADALFGKSEAIRKKIEEDKQKKPTRAPGAPASAGDTAQAIVGNTNRKRTWQQDADNGTKKPKTSVGRKKKDKKTIYINKRVAKAFEQENDDGKIETQIFFGTIDRLSNDAEPLLWHVQYDDDDEEEFDEKDIKAALKLYSNHEAADPNRITDVGGSTSEIDVADTNAAAPAETQESSNSPLPAEGEPPKPPVAAAPTQNPPASSAP